MTHPKTTAALLCVLLLCLTHCRQAPQLPAPKTNIAEKAMVVSAHPLATQVGVDILKKGGNAVDAAVAVQFALAVVYPSAGNIGGGGFMISRLKNGQTYALDYREMAPAAADRDMYLDDKGDVIKDLSFLGHLASGVPGAVAGMEAAHDSLGKLPWAELVQPSVDLAKGFPLTEKEANKLNGKLERLNKYNTIPNHFMEKEEWTSSDSLFMPDLAETFERIRDHGAKGFYEGKTADLIVAEMERGNGIMTLEDLKNYHAVWRTPIRGQYRGHDIISMPPPSSGGVALVQLLQMTEASPIPADTRFHPNTIHWTTEIERRVYADRATHLGDPDFYPVPIDGLLAKDYLLQRVESIAADRATNSDSVEAGQPMLAESEQTTHFSIVDADGNAVSVTTTLNGGYGSYVVVGGAGFLMNNEMDDFSAKPGVPNFFGLLGAEANAIQPGKRMLSSMTPTIVEKDGKLKMVVGTPGGSTIITSVYQNILNVLDYGMGMQESVSAPRIHHQWKPDNIQHEKNALSPETMAALKAMGHALKERGAIGKVDAILVLPDGRLEGGADPRGDDAAMGF
ncbi:MAG: gamma-glutamyltransferase [Bacteroidota bacterium]